MKKILSVLLASVLVVSMFALPSAADASYDVTATVGSVKGAKAGDEISIPVSLSQYDNAYAALHLDIIIYDSEVLEFVGFDDGEDFGGSLRVSGNGGYGMIAAPTSANAAGKVDGGVLVYLIFNVLVDVNTATTVDVEFSRFNVYTKGEADSWVEYAPANVTVIAGGIEVDDAKIKAAEVDALIDAIGSVTLNSEDAIVTARNAYDALDDEASSYVTKLSVLESKEYELYVLKNLGDIDGNGVVNLQDSLRTLQHFVGKIYIDDDKLVLADVNGSGEIELQDALLILQLFVGKIQEFPIVK